MSNDWQPGDDAFCIREDGGGYYDAPIIQRGQLVKVTEVVLIKERVGLGFVGYPIMRGWAGRIAYSATHFIKVSPKEADAEDAETIALLTGNPAKVSA